MRTVTVPRDRFAQICELAASGVGVVDAQNLNPGAGYKPGDDLGRILTTIWRADPGQTSVVFAAYMSNLWTVCSERGVTPPTLSEALLGFSRSLDEDLHPEAAELAAALAREVPQIYGGAI